MRVDKKNGSICFVCFLHFADMNIDVLSMKVDTEELDLLYLILWLA